MRCLKFLYGDIVLHGGVNSFLFKFKKYFSFSNLHLKFIFDANKLSLLKCEIFGSAELFM